MAFTFTKTTFTDGQTLTHTLLNTVQDNIALGSAAIAANSVTTTELESPHAYFDITVPLNLLTGNIGGTTSRVGLTASETNVDFPFDVPTACYLLKVTTSCVASQGTNTALVRKDSGDVSGSSTAFANGAKTTTSLSSAVAMATSNTLAVRANTSGGTNDGVAGAFVILHCRAEHSGD